jgi:hypothetical protein
MDVTSLEKEEDPMRESLRTFYIESLNLALQRETELTIVSIPAFTVITHAT